jgi:hypothetical protein
MQIVPPLSAGSEINVARWHFALQRKSHLESSIGSLTASTVHPHAPPFQIADQSCLSLELLVIGC